MLFIATFSTLLGGKRLLGVPSAIRTAKASTPATATNMDASASRAVKRGQLSTLQ
jgi:hypothetical protein